MGKVSILITLIFVLGCKAKRTPIDAFFISLNNSLSENEKSEVKNCEDIGCLTLFVQSKAQKKILTSYEPLEGEITQLLLDSFKIDKSQDRVRALILAYQKKLKNQSIDFFEIKNEIIQFDKLAEDKYLNGLKEEIQVQNKIARNNYERFKEGDVVNLLYPLSKDGNYKGVYFNNFYYNKEYTDTLFLKCVLLRKEMGNYDVHERLYFQLKIIEARNSELNLVDKKFSKGNIIVLPIYDYGRTINK